MSVIIHEKKTLASLPTLTSLVFNSTDIEKHQHDPAVGCALSGEEQKLANEEYIRYGLANDPKFDVWAPLVYYWTNGVTLTTGSIMVSIRGALAYEVDGDLHINHGDLDTGYPQASVTILGNQHTLQIARAVASTFLTIPDIYKGIDPSDLQVIHLDGQSHQCHFLNLEWKLNKSEAETDVIEKTVKLLNSDLPTEE